MPPKAKTSKISPGQKSMTSFFKMAPKSFSENAPQASAPTAPMDVNSPVAPAAPPVAPTTLPPKPTTAPTASTSNRGVVEEPPTSAAQEQVTALGASKNGFSVEEGETTVVVLGPEKPPATSNGQVDSVEIVTAARPPASDGVKIDVETGAPSNDIGNGGGGMFLGTTFSHKGPGGKWEEYSTEDSAAIAVAITVCSGRGTVRLSSAAFEVRWGTAATSHKMPTTPDTGLIQVNMASGNTRVVRWNNDRQDPGGKSPSSAWLSLSSSSSSSVQAAVQAAVGAAVGVAVAATPLSASPLSPSLSSSSSPSSSAQKRSSDDCTAPSLKKKAKATAAAPTAANSSSSSSDDGVAGEEAGAEAAVAGNGVAGDGVVDEDDTKEVVVCNWEDVTAAEEWCGRLLATLESSSSASSASSSASSSSSGGNGDGGRYVSVGLDCEWCPPWWQQGGMGDAIQTIQLYAPNLGGALVYSTGHKAQDGTPRALPPKLVEVLSHKRIIKVGVNLHGDGSRLASDFKIPIHACHNVQTSAANASSKKAPPQPPLLKRSSSLDEGGGGGKTAAKKKGKKGSDSSLEALAAKFCPPHLHVDKDSVDSKVRLGNWSAWPLSSEAIAYAASDAVVSYWIFAGVVGNGAAQWPAPLSPLPASHVVVKEEEEECPPEQKGSKKKGSNKQHEGNGSIELRSHSVPPPSSSSTSSDGGNAMKRAATAPADFANSGNGGDDADADAAEDDEAAAKKHKKSQDANASFFLMHRNRSIKPPKAGAKQYPEGPPTALKGVCVVVSGVLDSMSRDQMAEFVTKHGGALVKAVTKKTTHLVNDHGEIGPAKKAKCEAAGVAIVGEDALFDMVRAKM